MDHSSHSHPSHGDLPSKTHDHSGHGATDEDHAGYNKADSHSAGEHSKHEGHSLANFKKRFYISLFLTLPILFLSPFTQGLFNISIRFPGDELIVFLLATVIFFYGGLPFLKGAWRELKFRTPGMMTLISVAIIVAYTYSSAVVLGLMGEVFFWELATLIDIMLLGHWLEMKSIMGASLALEKLSKLIPDQAHIFRGKEIIEVDVNEIKKGDVILVKPGEKIPLDGVVLKGESFVNESMLTGEAKPVSKSEGAKVIGGSINEEGSLEIKVEKTGDETYLSKVIKLVKDAQGSKSKQEVLADRAAFWLTITAITIGTATFIAWMFVRGDLAFAIERAATVLIIACPHALGLAVPLVVAISTTLSAQNGLLIRNRTAFENARRITTIIFDKTGTLTKGTFSVKKIYSLDKDYGEDKVLALSAALEKNSEHPIARSILAEAAKKKLAIPEAKNFKAIKGKGVEAMVDNKKAILASPGLLREFGLDIPKDLSLAEGTMIFLVIGEKPKLIGAINLSDTIREESYEAIKLLKNQNIKIWMLTGDNESSAKSVSEELKLDGYFAGVLPHEKQEKVKELQDKGEYVAMVGDGINDAPAIARANVGIAIGSGTDIAAETADIILVNSDPKDIAALISFGKATYKKMVQNLAWATGYNVIAIPLAAGVLSGFGILLSPALGAVLMSLSTIIVAINAKTLKVK